MIKLDQTWSNWIKLNQIASNLIKLDQTYHIGSNMIKLDEIIETGNLSFSAFSISYFPYFYLQVQMLPRSIDISVTFQTHLHNDFSNQFVCPCKLRFQGQSPLRLQDIMKTFNQFSARFYACVNINETIKNKHLIHCRCRFQKDISFLFKNDNFCDEGILL